ncbi:MAG: hypothetical protein ACKO6I_00670 [Sphingomonadales bacterium]|nr:hypothetical protein [Sphingomonadales bacterium]
MKIKFNNIRDLSDARYAAAVMADYIGFRIGSEDDLPASAIQEIIGWCAGPAVILEIANDTDIDKINALLNTIPINGIELSEVAFSKLQLHLNNEQLIWIVNTEKSGNYISHSVNLNSKESHICSIEPSLEMAKNLQGKDPWGISINCFHSASTGIKDFSVWNDFFEALEIL